MQMTQEFALGLGLVMGGGMGFIGGGPLWALATVFYLSHVHRKEVEEIKKQAALEARLRFDHGVAEGKDSIETYTDFRTKGVFGRKLQYIVAVYDRREKRLRHLSGHTEDHELFSNIPPEVKEAIKTFILASAKILPLAA
jgi:hypothetical protein